MLDFIFKHLVKCNSVIAPEARELIEQHPDAQVVYLMPYATELAHFLLAKTVKRLKLPWNQELLQQAGVTTQVQAPVLALTTGSYVTLDHNSLNSQTVSALEKLAHYYGDKLIVVHVYNQWATSVVCRPNTSAQPNSLWAKVRSTTSFISLRKYAHVKLFKAQTTTQVANWQDWVEQTFKTYLERASVLNPIKEEITRDRLIKDILETPSVQEAINKTARKTSPEEQKTKARSFLEELAADITFFWVRFFGVFLRILWKRFYTFIDVRGVAKVEQTLVERKKATLVYIPTHRSHIDYLLLSYILSEFSGLKIPHIAAGVNLNFFPVGFFFRKGGAFFIRRSVKDYLYAAVFSTYVARLIKNQEDFEFFIEGGRSRTGRLLTPKTGILNMTLDGFLKNPDTDLYVVPIFISYDKVFESATYVDELKGKKKNKESAWLVLRNLKKVKYQGNVHANFGEPISVREAFDRNYPTWKQDLEAGCFDKGMFDVVSSDLGLRNMIVINANATVSDQALLASVIYRTDGKFARELLREQLDYLRSVLEHTQVYSEFLKVSATPAEDILRKMLRVNAKHVYTNTIQEVCFKPKSIVEFNYYRNNIEHAYVIPALAALTLERKFTAQQIQEFVELFIPVLNCFYFMELQTEQVIAQISRFQALLAHDKPEQWNLLSKQAYVVLRQLQAFLEIVVAEHQQMLEEGKETERVQLSALVGKVVDHLKQDDDCYVDYADKVTLTQLREAISKANSWDCAQLTQVEQALACISLWIPHVEKQD